MILKSLVRSLLVVAAGLATCTLGGTQERRQIRAMLGAPVPVEAPSTIQTIEFAQPANEAVLPPVVIKDQPTALGAPIATIKHANPSNTDLFWGRFSNRLDIGDGVGYTRGFTTLQAQLPIAQNSTSLFFADLRAVNFMTPNRWEGNLGLGYRWMSPRQQVIFGLNGYFDARKTDFHPYQQFGAGFEALTPDWEFRLNGYFIVGAAHREIGNTGLVNQGIVGGNFVFQQTRTIETALGGLDAEFGAPLPFLERYIPRAYIGYYTYAADGVPALHGIRARIEAQLNHCCSLHFAIQNDRLFDTTVSGGFCVHLGAAPYRAGTGRATWTEVLHQRVQRDVNIVITNTNNTATTTEPVPPSEPPPSEPPPPT